VAHNNQLRKLIPGSMQRHGFKPGITFQEQVQVWRGETSNIRAMVNRVACDLSYQPGWILRLDLNIMIKVLLYLRSKNVC
jgi:lipopolysaccharide/colanic/teichoic acid biosynthesis glycosyltransferase